MLPRLLLESMWTESQKAEKLAETETKQTVLEKGGKPKVLEDMV